jgi:tetratricopeptide (TPR) repeat protein
VIATRKLAIILGGVVLAAFTAGCGSSKSITQGSEEFSIDEGLYFEALRLQDDGDHFNAIKAWQELLDDEPRFAQGHYNLGVLYDKLEMIPEATDHYERAVRLVEEHDNEKAAQSKYNLNLGGAYLRRGLEHEAEAALAITIRFDPYNALAHYNMSAALLAQGNHDDALLHADIAVDLTAIPDAKSLAGLDKNVDRTELSNYLLRQAECHLVREEWAKARASLERCKNQCKVEPAPVMWDRLNAGEKAASENAKAEGNGGAESGGGE